MAYAVYNKIAKTYLAGFDENNDFALIWVADPLKARTYARHSAAQSQAYLLTRSGIKGIQFKPVTIETDRIDIH